MEVLQRTANRGSISTGYEIDNSLKLEADNSEYLNRTPGANGSRTTWTTSVWVKRTELGVDQAIFSSVNNPSNTNFYRFLNSDKIRFYFQPDDTAVTYYADTNAVFRDTSAWYHIVWGLDSTNSDGSKRFVVYVNGVYQDSTWAGSATASTNCAQNSGSLFLQSQPIQIGKGTYGADHYFSGYMAELHVLDGIAPDPTDFGEYDEDSGIWKPKAYTGSHGTQGFYLDFADASDLGDDKSGNGNDFTENNITSADQATDTPTNNFCTFNPLMTQNNPPTISEGATKSTGGGGTWNQTWGNMGVKNGKWYYEFKVTNTSSSGYFGASTTPAGGGSTTGASLMYNTSFMLGSPSRIDYYYWQNGSQVSNESTGWGTISTNDIIGIALDLDSSTKKFIVYKNGSALNGSGTDLPTNMQDEFIFPLYVQYENRADEANFGGYTISSISSAASDGNGHGTFEIAPPSGYLAICTKNIAETG